MLGLVVTMLLVYPVELRCCTGQCARLAGDSGIGFFHSGQQSDATHRGRKRAVKFQPSGRLCLARTRYSLQRISCFSGYLVKSYVRPTYYKDRVPSASAIA